MRHKLAQDHTLNIQDILSLNLGDLDWRYGWKQTGTPWSCYESDIIPGMPNTTFPDRPSHVIASFDGNFSIYDTPGAWNWCINSGRMRIYLDEDAFPSAIIVKEFFDGVFLAYLKDS